MNDEKELKREFKIKITRGTKASLMVALVFFIIGAGCCLAAFCMGFSIKDVKQFSEIISQKEISREEFSERYTEVEELELDLGIIECSIIPWEKDYIEIKGENLPDNFSSKQRDERLEIKSHGNAARMWMKDGTSFLDIYIPADQVFEEVRIDAGAGSVETQNGAVRCNILNLNSGVGACRIAADILEEAEIESGIGEVVLILTGQEDDYDYELECGIGALRIGDLEISGAGQEWKKDNDAKKKITAECGIGALKIEFSN